MRLEKALQEASALSVLKDKIIAQLREKDDEATGRVAKDRRQVAKSRLFPGVYLLDYIEHRTPWKLKKRKRLGNTQGARQRTRKRTREISKMKFTMMEEVTVNS